MKLWSVRLSSTTQLGRQHFVAVVLVLVEIIHKWRCLVFPCRLAGRTWDRSSVPESEIDGRTSWSSLINHFGRLIFVFTSLSLAQTGRCCPNPRDRSFASQREKITAQVAR